MTLYRVITQYRVVHMGDDLMEAIVAFHHSVGLLVDDADELRLVQDESTQSTNFLRTQRTPLVCCFKGERLLAILYGVEWEDFLANVELGHATIN